MKNKKRLIVLVLVLALLVGATVGGTIAWLVTETDPIVNTFTVGDINITLDEDGAVNGEQSFKMVPGATIEKKPVVTVEGGSEDCWLFVKVEAANTADYIDYAIAEGWEEVDATNGIYGRKVAANTANQPFDILEDNKVTVKTTVTKGMMEEINNGTQKAPTLTFTAYAIQSENLKIKNADDTSTNVVNAEQAWEVYNTPTT